jgi:hypothetical protein
MLSSREEVSKTDLTDIVDIEEVISETTAKKYLDCGWVLINTVAVQCDCGEDSHILMLLGWPSAKGEVKRPFDFIQARPD